MMHFFAKANLGKLRFVYAHSTLKQRALVTSHRPSAGCCYRLGHAKIESVKKLNEKITSSQIYENRKNKDTPTHKNLRMNTKESSFCLLENDERNVTMNKNKYSGDKYRKNAAKVKFIEFRNDQQQIKG